LSGSSTLNVKVEPPPTAERLDVVYTKRYSIDNPLCEVDPIFKPLTAENKV
jgi:hypothetical protein